MLDAVKLIRRLAKRFFGIPVNIGDYLETERPVIFPGPHSRIDIRRRIENELVVPVENSVRRKFETTGFAVNSVGFLISLYSLAFLRFFGAFFGNFLKVFEIELYCHSTRKESKEKAIADRFSSRFEAELGTLRDGLSKKGCVKRYEKVVEKVGRLKQKYSKAAKNYKVDIEKHSTGVNVKEITWKLKERIDSQDSHPGLYCLRTNWKDQATLWRTYIMLTDLEAVFRSLKSELGLRPVYHQTTERVSGHLFITVLAYHVVHNIRCRLKEKGIHSSWETLRNQLEGQYRVTTTMNRKDGRTIHVRKATKAEPMQQAIYGALGISCTPGRIVKTTI